MPSVATGIWLQIVVPEEVQMSATFLSLAGAVTPDSESRHRAW